MATAQDQPLEETVTLNLQDWKFKNENEYIGLSELTTTLPKVKFTV